MKKIKESKQNLTEGLMSIIYNKLMKGKKNALINAFDHNPKVKRDLEDVDAALNKLKKSLADFEKLKRSK
tara:strand:+ start:2495 stop:2704 length:210 start_codon:yes stop_codon:yes gene_type:complete